VKGRGNILERGCAPLRLSPFRVDIRYQILLSEFKKKKRRVKSASFCLENIDESCIK